MRLRLYQIVHTAQPGDTISHCYDIFIVVVAFISVFPFMFKDGMVGPEVKQLFNFIDVVTVFILFSDYLLRWITYDIHCGKGWKSFVLYPITPIAIIDLLAILPSVTILSDGLKFLRVLRIIRILRMSKGLVILTNVFRKEAKPLASVVFFIFVYIFATALIMFNVEPDMFDNFLEALYWSSTSLATIGYGDITPQSHIGQIIMMVSAILGIAVIAFPAGIITGGYLTQIHNAESEGESYFYEYTTRNKAFKGRNPQDYTGIVDYVKSNRKVVIYAIYILIGIIINISTTYLQYITDPFVLFNDFGTIMITILLEPAAGLMVGLLSSFYWVIIFNSASDILFYGNTIVYIILFSVYCRRGKKIKLKNVLIILILGIILPSILTMLVPLCSSVSINYYSNFYTMIHEYSAQYNINVNIIAIAFLVVINSVYLIVDFIGVFIVRRFIYGCPIDPMMLLSKKERYSFNIHSDATHKNEYIEDWAEDDAEQRDWEDIASVGKSSINKSLEKVETRQDKIKEMEEKMLHYEKEIIKHQELVVEEQQEIDIKKKAVRKAVKKSKSATEN